MIADKALLAKLSTYTDLGFLPTLSTAMNACIEAGHHRYDVKRPGDVYRCTDVLIVCDTCRHFWHVDMSD